MKKYYSMFFWVCVFVGIFDIMTAIVCYKIGLLAESKLLALSSVLMVLGAFFHWFNSERQGNNL